MAGPMHSRGGNPSRKPTKHERLQTAFNQSTAAERHLVAAREASRRSISGKELVDFLSRHSIQPKAIDAALKEFARMERHRVRGLLSEESYRRSRTLKSSMTTRRPGARPDSVEALNVLVAHEPVRDPDTIARTAALMRADRLELKEALLQAGFTPKEAADVLKTWRPLQKAQGRKYKSAKPEPLPTPLQIIQLAAQRGFPRYKIGHLLRDFFVYPRLRRRGFSRLQTEWLLSIKAKSLPELERGILALGHGGKSRTELSDALEVIEESRNAITDAWKAFSAEQKKEAAKREKGKN